MNRNLLKDLQLLLEKYNQEPKTTDKSNCSSCNSTVDQEFACNCFVDFGVVLSQEVTLNWFGTPYPATASYKAGFCVACQGGTANFDITFQLTTPTSTVSIGTIELQTFDFATNVTTTGECNSSLVTIRGQRGQLFINHKIVGFVDFQIEVTDPNLPTGSFILTLAARETNPPYKFLTTDPISNNSITSQPCTTICQCQGNLSSTTTDDVTISFGSTSSTGTLEIITANFPCCEDPANSSLNVKFTSNDGTNDFTFVSDPTNPVLSTCPPNQFIGSGIGTLTLNNVTTTGIGFTLFLNKDRTTASYQLDINQSPIDPNLPVINTAVIPVPPSSITIEPCPSSSE